jgi:hypothetical protein
MATSQSSVRPGRAAEALEGINDYGWSPRPAIARCSQKQKHGLERGSCVDSIAPGVNITAAWLDSDTATNTISGTSMATPHAAGAAAKFLSANPSATPATVTSALVQASTRNVVALPTCRPGPFRPCPAATPNQLLFTNL